MRNVIFIGETGSGKSSIINLIAGCNHAAVSPDVTPCTNAFALYDVSIRGRTYRLWDTPGLSETSRSTLFGQSSQMTEHSLKRFLQARRRRGELDLLVLCVRGGRAHQAMSRIYKTFCSTSRRIGIPVVIAVTHLERVQPAMDYWWPNNERELTSLGLLFDGYACLTCLSPHHRRWASQQDICALISAEFPQPKEALSLLSDQEYLDDPSGCAIC